MPPPISLQQCNSPTIMAWIGCRSAIGGDGPWPRGYHARLTAADARDLSLQIGPAGYMSRAITVDTTTFVSKVIGAVSRSLRASTLLATNLTDMEAARMAAFAIPDWVSAHNVVHNRNLVSKVSETPYCLVDYPGGLVTEPMKHTVRIIAPLCDAAVVRQFVRVLQEAAKPSRF